VRGQGRLIVQAPTGSGKSTQVPQMRLNHGLLGGGEVVLLQSRCRPVIRDARKIWINRSSVPLLPELRLRDIT